MLSVHVGKVAGHGYSVIEHVTGMTFGSNLWYWTHNKIFALLSWLSFGTFNVVL